MEIAGLASYEDSSGERAFAGKQTLGREDFMNLLLKELSYQDPLEPMDSKEFIVQITQFTSLEELTSLNDKLDEVLSSQRSMQNTAVTGMIGKKVKVEGNSTYLRDTADISYDLTENASSVKVFIRDGGGSTVWAEELGEQAAGSYSFSWEGRDLQGNRVPEGSYSFDIAALNIHGDPVGTSTRSSGMITSVVYDEGKPFLVIDGSRKVDLEEVKSIDE